MVSEEELQSIRDQVLFSRALLGRIDSGRSPEGQVVLIGAGVQAIRQLLELRFEGHDVDESIVYCFERLGEGLQRLQELLEPWARGIWP